MPGLVAWDGTLILRNRYVALDHTEPDAGRYQNEVKLIANPSKIKGNQGGAACADCGKIQAKFTDGFS